MDGRERDYESFCFMVRLSCGEYCISFLELGLMLEMKDLKRGSRLVEDVNDRAGDQLCPSIFLSFSFFWCQYGFFVCRETRGAFFCRLCLQISWDLLGVGGRWVGGLTCEALHSGSRNQSCYFFLIPTGDNLYRDNEII